MTTKSGCPDEVREEVQSLTPETSPSVEKRKHLALAHGNDFNKNQQ